MLFGSCFYFLLGCLLLLQTLTAEEKKEHLLTVVAYPPQTPMVVGTSTTGHSFVILTDNQGHQLTLGKYPGMVRIWQHDSSSYPEVIFYTWNISPEAFQAIQTKAVGGLYLSITENCSTLVSEALKLAGIDIGSFKTYGIDNPTKVVEALERLRGSSCYTEKLYQACAAVWDSEEPDEMALSISFYKYLYTRFFGPLAPLDSFR